MYATHEAKFLLDGGCAQPAHAKIVWKKRKKKEQTCYTDEATKNIKNISLLLWDTFLRVWLVFGSQDRIGNDPFIIAVSFCLFTLAVKNTLMETRMHHTYT